MTVTKIELANFYSALDQNGSAVYTKEFTVFFTGEWNPIDLEGGVTVDSVTIPDLGVAGDIASKPAHYAASITPTLVDVMAGLGKVVVVYRDDQNWELLAGEKDTVTWDDQQQVREVAFDYDEKPIVNTARQVFSQLPQVPFSLRSITVQGVRSSLMIGPPSRWKLVNSGSVSIDGESFPAGTLWMVGRHAETIKVNGVKKYFHSWTMLANADKHDLTVANVGTMDRATENSPLRPIVKGGIKITQPWPLGPLGQALDDDYATEDLYDNRLTFKVTEDYDFNNFDWTF